MGKLQRKVTAADLFCGAGGTSTGLARACKELRQDIELVAINHWSIAIETHKANHPWARHLCESIESLDPMKVVPSGRLKLLVASPECKHHARARGGRPMNDQLRATAWHILKWVQELYIENVLIENVPEFEEWGPLGANGRPLKSKKGLTFRAFLDTLRSLGYKVEYRELNAADFGDATSRKRLFIIARRPAHKAIHWPEPTHTKEPAALDLFQKFKPWRAAREIIDWSLPGESIFTRKKPLAKSTMERIMAGLEKFCGEMAQPFLVILRQHMAGRSIKEPLPTVAAGGQHVALCEPFILQQQSGGAPRSVSKPVPTIAGKGAQALVEPFLIGLDHTGSNGKQVRGLKDPVPTINGHGRFGLAQPFLVRFHGDHKGKKDGKKRTHSVDESLPSQDGSNRYALATPFLIPFYNERKGQKPRSHGVDSPVPTIPASGGGKFGLIQSFLVSTSHGGGKGRRAHSIKEPLKTVTGSKEYALVQPFILPQNKSNKARSVERPLQTLTTTSRGVALVQPFIITPGGPKLRNGRSVKEPLPTVMCKDRMGVVQPFIFTMEHSKSGKANGRSKNGAAYILPTHHGNGDKRTYSMEGPMPTITTVDAWGMVEPFLVKFYRNKKNQHQSVKEPLHTVTCKDRHALASPCLGALGLDIRFRMLKPHELAAAMGFPKNYQFSGNREDQVKQIGNAVACGIAKALCKALLKD
jgi:DNA (cytosine-5)-methyltransferase 1